MFTPLARRTGPLAPTLIASSWGRMPTPLERAMADLIFGQQRSYSSRRGGILVHEIADGGQELIRQVLIETADPHVVVE